MKSCRPPPLALQCKAVFFLWLNNKLNTAFVLVKSSVFFSLPSPSHSYLLQFIMKLFSFCCVDISLLTPWKLKSVSVKVHVSFVKKNCYYIIESMFFAFCCIFCASRSEQSESMINVGTWKLTMKMPHDDKFIGKIGVFEYAVLAKQLWI